MDAAEPAFRAHLRRAIQTVGSQAELARRATRAGLPISQQEISRLLNVSDVISDNVAVAVHVATGGVVPASDLRPDRWRQPSDVPLDVILAATGGQPA